MFDFKNMSIEELEERFGLLEQEWVELKDDLSLCDMELDAINNEILKRNTRCL